MLQSGKEGIYRTFERFSFLLIDIHNALKTDVEGIRDIFIIAFFI
jgi:hypothetical protein